MKARERARGVKGLLTCWLCARGLLGLYCGGVNVVWSGALCVVWSCGVRGGSGVEYCTFYFSSSGPVAPTGGGGGVGGGLRRGEGGVLFNSPGSSIIPVRESSPAFCLPHKTQREKLLILKSLLHNHARSLSPRRAPPRL